MVEGELITAYQASRSVFRRSADGGLEWLVRPRIDEAVARNAAHRALLQEWADTVASAEGREVALAIIAAADARGRLRTAEGPSSAAAGLASVAAGFRLEGLEVEEREFLEQAILGANALMREAASPPIVQALREAGLAFGGLRDFKSDARPRPDPRCRPSEPRLSRVAARRHAGAGLICGLSVQGGGRRPARTGAASRLHALRACRRLRRRR